MKNLWLPWLSTCSLALVFFSCSQEITDREAPGIALNPVDPFIYAIQPDSIALQVQFSDNESATVSSLFTCTYFDVSTTALNKDTFYYAFAEEITDPRAQRLVVNNPVNKPGFYWLEVQAGDRQGNASSATQLVYFDSVNTPFQQDKLVPFSLEDTIPFWSLAKTDSLLLKKFILADADSLTQITLLTMPYNSGNVLPQTLASKTWAPKAAVRLDTLGYFNFSTALDTAHLVIVASDKLGNPLSYSHPVIFGN